MDTQDAGVGLMADRLTTTAADRGSFFERTFIADTCLLACILQMHITRFTSIVARPSPLGTETLKSDHSPGLRNGGPLLSLCCRADHDATMCTVINAPYGGRDDRHVPLCCPKPLRSVTIMCRGGVSRSDANINIAYSILSKAQHYEGLTNAHFHMTQTRPEPGDLRHPKSKQLRCIISSAPGGHAFIKKRTSK